MIESYSLRAERPIHDNHQLDIERIHKTIAHALHGAGNVFAFRPPHETSLTQLGSQEFADATRSLRRDDSLHLSTRTWLNMLQENLPASAHQPIEARVVGITLVANTLNPSLALMLRNPDLDNERQKMNSVVQRIGGNALRESAVGPHLTIGTFLDRSYIEPAVISIQDMTLTSLWLRPLSLKKAMNKQSRR